MPTARPEELRNQACGRAVATGSCTARNSIRPPSPPRAMRREMIKTIAEEYKFNTDSHLAQLGLRESRAGQVDLR